MTEIPARSKKNRSQPPPDESTVVIFLRRVIAALTLHDVNELHLLLGSVDVVGASLQGASIEDARSLHRLLGAVLLETERNLRLLRKVGGGAAPISYRSIHS